MTFPWQRVVSGWIGLALMIFLSGVVSCKDKKRPPDSKKAQRCRDFADIVGGAYQRYMTARGEGSSQVEKIRAQVDALRTRLSKECVEGIIDDQKVTCVFDVSPKTYRKMGQCLDAEDLPDLELTQKPL